ncbi:FecR domain-containing protein [Flavitalea sp. BT771]|uniref:FecR family protein n=1 Tax=Flavitalea sp. BT771 TaxID=3063329 RepID=UPI0026E13768|nr:FecR family protein [Flavitalea sp. BT771]MDO6430710.1 FecR domain-containing protein [Flavitalea sp. BT771]MDV6219150.1 FecR domain-containing protein [Flavitalea sp. BT771]
MGPTNERIKDLIIKHLKDELTVEEQLELQEWIRASDEHRLVFDRLSDPDGLNEELREFHEIQAAIWNKVDARIKVPGYSSTVVRPLWPRVRVYVVAASLLIIFATSFFWLASLFHAPSKARSVPTPVVAQDVAPGGNRATLTLGDGSRLVLDSAANGRLAVQGAAHVSKEKNLLSYTAGTEKVASPAIVYNTLTTPRAGQFQVVLPDGTKVWLNNASSLRYPTSFSGYSRIVELTGEGYFEVAKNTRPFSLKVRGLSVNVLGTSFNVMAYDDELRSKTTLITGKVSIAAASGNSVLSPGEQGIVDHSGAITILKDADIAAATAWQRGFFQYANANIADVLRQLARWYDVEVVFTMPIPDNYTFDGEIDRSLNLSRILKHLEKPDLHFHIEGKKLIVSK